MHESRQTSLFPSASLEPPETKSQNDYDASGGDALGDESLSERFRHSGWQHNRKLVYNAIRATRQSVSRIVNFSSCGHTSFVYRTQDPPFRYRLGGSNCHDRFCLPCAQDRSRCLATNVINALENRPTRFVTLTLKQRPEELAATITRLYDCFRKLRTRAWWKRLVSGGAAFLEIVFKPRTETWNVHLHMVVHGQYLPQRMLSQEWFKITGDSHIVDIRFVHNQKTIGSYVVKYCSKPFNNSFVNRRQELETVITATKGRRLCLTFGDWRGIKLTETPCERDWIALGSFGNVIDQAINGDTESLEAIESICGENTEAIMAAARRARPPPKPMKKSTAQLTFAWQAVDCRF